MTNQNSWIEAMKKEWTKPEYAKMKLVDTVYGDDQDDKSYREMQGLVKTHPEPQGHHLADDRSASAPAPRRSWTAASSARSTSPASACRRK